MIKIHALLCALALMASSAAYSAHVASQQILSIQEVKHRALQGSILISNQQLKDRIKQNPRLVLLDVRTQREFQAGHLKGAAWVERGIAEFLLARTLTDRNVEIIVYCKKGYRASLVVKALLDIGYINVVAHAGFDEWVLAGNNYSNYLGESKLVTPKTITAASFKPNYYLPKH